MFDGFGFCWLLLLWRWWLLLFWWGNDICFFSIAALNRVMSVAVSLSTATGSGL